MITLTAKINLLSGDNKALSIGLNNLSGNNLTPKKTDGTDDLSVITGKKQVGSNPFIIGASKLGDGSTFSNGVDYFIGDHLSNENGDFAYTADRPKELNGVKTNHFFPSRFEGIVEKNFYGIMQTLQFSIEDIEDYVPNKIVNLYLEANFVSYTGEIKNYSTENSILTPQYQIIGFTLSKNFLYLQIRFLIPRTFANDYKTIEEVALICQHSTGNIVVKEIIQYFDYEIEIVSKSEINSLTIDFDKINNRHPKRIYIDNVEYIDDDPIFTIANLNSSRIHKIRIDNWNSPNYPLVITGIYAEININIDYRNLISISRSIFDRSDLKLPSFGIISNTGNIEFNDIDGEVRDYAEQLLLQSGLSCEIKLNNTLVDGASETIGLFETDQWDYDNDNRVVSVSLKDDLEEWQEINVSEIKYEPNKPQHKSFAYFYEHLWKLTSNRSSYVNANGETITSNGNYNMLSIVDLDEDTQAVLNNTYIQYPLLESGSLWQQWTKLCQACQLHIYKNNDGVIVCRYNGGN